MVRRKGSLILLPLALVYCLLLVDSLLAQGTLVFTDTPADSWRYRRLYNAGPPVCTYFPRETSEYQDAAFQGYVTYNDPTGGVFGPIYTDPPRTFHIFTTYVLSDSDITIPIRISGDDGHSLFVNDRFLGGGGFAVDVSIDVKLKGGETTKLELAGHDSCPQGWVFLIHVRDGFRLPIDFVPGIRLNADGDFSGVEDP